MNTEYLKVKPGTAGFKEETVKASGYVLDCSTHLLASLPVNDGELTLSDLEVNKSDTDQVTGNEQTAPRVLPVHITHHFQS